MQTLHASCMHDLFVCTMKLSHLSLYCLCLGAFVWLCIYFGLPEEGMAGAAAVPRGLGGLSERVCTRTAIIFSCSHCTWPPESRYSPLCTLSLSRWINRAAKTVPKKKKRCQNVVLQRITSTIHRSVDRCYIAMFS